MSVDKASERLDAYERGLGADADVVDYEEELFARAVAGDAPELALRDSLEASVHAMARRGTIELFPTAREVAALRARPDLDVAYFDLDEIPPDQIKPSEHADIVITRVGLDVRNVTRLDVEVGFEGVGVLKTMPDIGFDRDDGAVFFCCEASLARSIHGRPFGRFWAIDGDQRTLVAEIVVTTCA